MNIKTAYDNSSGCQSAADKIYQAIDQPGIKIVLVFSSPKYDPSLLMENLSARFKNIRIAGCTTAGEISGQGFIRDGIVAASFAGDDLEVSAEVISNLAKFSTADALKAVQNCSSELGIPLDSLSSSRHFGITLIDGLSGKEEAVISAIALAAPNIKIAGGSAGDAMELRNTYVFLDGEVHRNSAVFILFQCEIPFKVFNRHHFIPTKHEIVISKARTGSRIIMEIDGKPAVARYADLLEVRREEINENFIWQYPFGFEVDGRFYIRSILNTREDTLLMASAVNDGTVLTIMKPGDMLADTRELVRDLNTELNGISFLILFNCYGRFAEAEMKRINNDIFDALHASPLIGFNTLGEQYCSMHINHSITGVAFGGV